jgi:hypothetical protein
VYSRSVLSQFLTVAVAIAGPFQGDKKRAVVNGFGDEVGGIQLEGAHGQFHLGKGGGHDHFDLGMTTLDPFENLESVHTGHADVRNDQLRMATVAEVQSSRTVGGADDGISGILKGQAGHLANVGLVVDEQYQPLGWIHGHPFIFGGSMEWISWPVGQWGDRL